MIGVATYAAIRRALQISRSGLGAALGFHVRASDLGQASDLMRALGELRVEVRGTLGRRASWLVWCGERPARAQQLPLLEVDRL